MLQGLVARALFVNVGRHLWRLVVRRSLGRVTCVRKKISAGECRRYSPFTRCIVAFAYFYIRRDETNIILLREFTLIVGTVVFLILVSVGSISLLYTIGSQELPGTLTGGLGGPLKRE